MINRLIEPTSGRILLDGDDILSADAVELRRQIGYVIQHVGLFPHQTIAANVATVPRLLGWPKERTRQRVNELLELVGLDPARYGKRYPSELSGGQHQRVGVARALAADPVVLLMDEPFSAVDPIVRVRLQDEFLRLQRTVRKTIVFVTHDLDEAVRLADRVVVLSEDGDARAVRHTGRAAEPAGERVRPRVHRHRPGHQAPAGHADRAEAPGPGGFGRRCRSGTERARRQHAGRRPGRPARRRPRLGRRDRRRRAASPSAS